MKAIPGGDHVDLNRRRRTDSALAARFRAFADLECAPAGSGMSVDSPTYALLARHVATRGPLLALARECRPGQPIPNLLFAAVKRLVADEPDTPLALFYGRAPRHGPSQELAQAFEKFCTVHAEADRRLGSKPQRTDQRGRPLFAPDACFRRHCAGDGAESRVDRHRGRGWLEPVVEPLRYRYSDGSTFGSGRSPVRIECESRGEMPRIPTRFPATSFSAGVDLNPIDLGDDEQYRWLEALIWPEHADRTALLANAREIWLQHPPRVEAGDALALLPVLVAEAPADSALCVFHCHALNQFPVEARESFMGLLRSAAQSRPVFHVSSEGERMDVVRLEEGRSTTLLSVSRSAHGRWVQW